MTIFGTTSSQNWQFFPQRGRYFIRNYDFGSAYQLGLTEGDKKVPAMYTKSGSISQQWSINKVEGGWELVNGLLGNETMFSLPPGDKIPSMVNRGSNSIWNITRNPSADASGPKGPDMFSLVVGFEVVQPSQSPSLSLLPSSSSTNTQFRSSATLFTHSSATSTSVTLKPDAPTNPASSSMSKGAMAGIGIGAVAFLVALSFSIWFLLSRWQQSKSNPHEQQEETTREIYAYRAELDISPTELPIMQEQCTFNRVELESKLCGAGTRTPPT
ncbi:hypothetical protein GQ44DRAFT_775555 [Phaeosphaeriaceae sp. PMI808]|nr:hypothetical protein GQ44DRAFT_775555 [Phaeosphaeriaceae sp. PMI808]